MMKQVNKHRKEINYEIKSKMFLNKRNIVTAKLFKKLDDKMLNSFKITNSVDFFYKLKLSNTMHIHDCYDPSYAPMLVAMLVAMLMTIAGRSPLGYRVVPRPTLFRVSLCSPESYR